ncbi:MAG: shikimate kinase [Planctomycetes bacterium]|nr:shikimate kinase [Planctomycetota bacterium]
MMILTLIGYRGCGKSAVAGQLAERLGCASIDADAEIEKRAGCSIREIFQQGGEEEFRRRERLVLSELLQRDGLVIAAGGGAVMNPQTRREMKSAGVVVWLRASVQTLWGRIRNDVDSDQRRPPLTAVGGREEIEKMLGERTPVYRDCASVVIDTDDDDVPAVVERILESLANDLHGGGRA